MFYVLETKIVHPTAGRIDSDYIGKRMQILSVSFCICKPMQISLKTLILHMKTNVNSTDWAPFILENHYKRLTQTHVFYHMRLAIHSS